MNISNFLSKEYRKAFIEKGELLFDYLSTVIRIHANFYLLMGKSDFLNLKSRGKESTQADFKKKND